LTVKTEQRSGQAQLENLIIEMKNIPKNMQLKDIKFCIVTVHKNDV
jgi:hypothetical protein